MTQAASLPVLDFSRFDAGPAERARFLADIGAAARDVGFFYLLGRAVTPPAGTERLSLGFFLGANLNATVPLLTLPPDLGAHARGVTRDPNNPLIREVGLNALKSRLRSHPDAARRHHGDLLARFTPVRQVA